MKFVFSFILFFIFVVPLLLVRVFLLLPHMVRPADHFLAGAGTRHTGPVCSPVGILIDYAPVPSSDGIV